MVKTLQSNEDKEWMEERHVNSLIYRKKGRHLEEMAKAGRDMKAMAGRISCAVNEKERGDFEESGSDMEMSFGQEQQVKEKRAYNFEGSKSRKQRRVTYSDEERGSEEIEEFKVILRFREGNGVQALNPVKLTTVLKNQVGDIKLAKVLRDGNLLILCKNKEQSEKAYKMKEVGKCKVISASKVGMGERGAKGVIWGIPLEMSTDEIKANIKGGKIKEAKRLTMFKEGVRTETGSILLEFEGENLPTKVTLGYIAYSVREYIPKPLRCFKCQRFGHNAAVCKGRVRCPRCGEDHEYENCGRKMQPKCCSCGGEHSVTYAGCQIMKREMQIQQVRVKNKTSYAEAVKMVNQKTEDRNGGVREESNNRRIGEEEGKVWVDLKKLVTFIAGVINATMETKSKTERIQIIVKAAVNHLDINNLTWEEVRSTLSTQANQDMGNAG